MIDHIEDCAAIIAGTGRYSTALPPEDQSLPQAVQNVKDLFVKLTDVEYVGIPSDRVTLLFDPTVEEILRGIREVAELSPKSLLFYYAGHGYPKQNQLLFPTSAATKDDRDNVSLNAQVLSQRLAEVENCDTFVILDTCFSKEFFSILGNFDAASRMAADSFANSVAFASASNFAEATHPIRRCNSMFTGELLSVIEGGMSGMPEILTAQQVFSAVKAGISEFGGPVPEVRGDATELRFVKNSQQGVLTGGRLESIGALYQFLCDARKRCKSRIRLTQIRNSPPAKIDYQSQEIVRDADNRPELVVRSDAATQWYEGLKPWAQIPGHQIERITLGLGDPLIYAKELHQEMQTEKATWSTRFLDPKLSELLMENDPKVEDKTFHLPVYNFCIFDDKEITLTIGKAWGDTGYSLWFRDPYIVSFFARVYEQIKETYSSEYQA